MKCASDKLKRILFFFKLFCSQKKPDFSSRKADYVGILNV